MSIIVRVIVAIYSSLISYVYTPCKLGCTHGYGRGSMTCIPLIVPQLHLAIDYSLACIRHSVEYAIALIPPVLLTLVNL